MDIDNEAIFSLNLWIFPNNMESFYSYVFIIHVVIEPWFRKTEYMKNPAIGFTIVDSVRGIWHFIYNMINVQVRDTKTILERPMVASGISHNDQIYTNNIQR